MTDVMEKDVRYLRLLNLFAFIAMVAMNLVAELVPLNGVTSGQVSDMYASLFTPAGITFSIWGVIYLALAYFAFWQAFLAKKEDIDRIGISFAITCGLNILWLVLWHYKLVYVATIVILALLVVLFQLRDSIANTNWAVKASFSIYLAWITMASIASLFIVAGLIFKNFSFSVLAQILVWVAALAAVFLSYRRLKKDEDYAYSAAMVWALFGIMLKHASASGFNGQYVHIIVGSSLSILMILVLVVLRISKRQESKPVLQGA